MIKVDYTNSLINISASLLKHYNCFTKYQSLKELDYYLKKDYNHVILIVLDGLGVNIINENLNDDDLLKKNIKHIASSIFPPTTVAATNALLSGEPPFSNGFVGWMQYNKFDDAHEVVFFNSDYYNPNKKLSTKLYEDILAYDNILDIIKRNNRDLHVELLFPSFHKTNGYFTFDDQLNRLLMITQKKKSFSYCYYTEPDSTIHTSGVKGRLTNLIVKGLNQSYERFLTEINDDVLVIVTADHGLVDVKPVLLYKYKDIIETYKRLPALEARATTFFIKEDKKEEFEELFYKYFKDDFILLTKEEVYEEELLGYGIKHELLDSFIGDYLAVAVKNKMFQLTKDKPFTAHHAGLTKEELEIPIIINK